MQSDISEIIFIIILGHCLTIYPGFMHNFRNVHTGAYGVPSVSNVQKVRALLQIVRALLQKVRALLQLCVHFS